MKSHFIRVLLSASLILLPFFVFSQLPYSPCSPTGGKKANILGVETKYRAPGGAAPTFTIPAGTKSIAVFVSSETGIPTGGDDFERADEDFISISAIIDMASATSSGFVNYAKSTINNGTGTNVYGWKNVALGAQIPDASKLGDKAPDLNNVNFSITGSTLTITENATAIHSSYYVEYLSPATNSFDPLPTLVRALEHGPDPINSDLVIPIPAGASVITISGKGVNASPLDTTDFINKNGLEEGYANIRITIDLDAGLTNGFVTLANGGTDDRRSTYVVSDMNSTYNGDLIGSGNATGDYAAKNVNPGAVGLYDPRIYVNGTNLIIRRNDFYARDFDDSYVIEFYKRVGQGMSAEFIDSDTKFVAAQSYPTEGVAKTFKIPSGTNFIYFNENANATNSSIQSNENPVAVYGYIDLVAETATGYYFQQVGYSSGRRDDNYAFKDLPLDSSNARDHISVVGAKSPLASTYDLRFKLSADKSELTVTNRAGSAQRDYQFLMSTDFFGARPDVAFNTSNITFTKGGSCETVKVNVEVCNPGSGNATGGMPVAFYDGDPTTNPAAKLLYVSSFDQQIKMGECKPFSFDLSLNSYPDLNIDLTVIINDDGSFVPGGVGNAVGTPFTLASLATQNPYYKECFYDNNIITRTINVNNCPVIDPDPDHSSGAGGSYAYLNYFTAGSTTGAKIVDNDLSAIDPDGGDVYGATITLTNILNAGQEGIQLNGALPAGITISGDGTGVVTLSGQASQADYIAAIKLLEYLNSNKTPNLTDRNITIVLNDGVENGPAANTTIKILTQPIADVTGNSISIADNSTTTNTANGTDFGSTTGTTITHTFNVQNAGTGVLTLIGTPLVSISGDPGFVIATQPATTSLSASAATPFEVRFDPASQAAGVYTATITIQNSDADADRADYTFVVTVKVNHLPTVSNGNVTGDEDNTLAFNNTDFTGKYTDVDNNPLDKIKVLSLPLHGSLQLNGTPITIGQEIAAADLANITFVPDANWWGTTSFNWVASDGSEYATAPATMTITINPVNDAPVATVPAGQNLDEEVKTALPGISFADIDAGTASVKVTISAPSGSLSAVSGNGVTVSGTPAALVLDGKITDINAFIQANGLSYTSVDNPPASVIVTVNIDDNGNMGAGGNQQDTKTITLTFTLANDPPTGNGDTKVTDQDKPVSGSVTGSDPNGDPLTFTKGTDPANGSVVVNPDGTYTYTPDPGYSGNDSFTVIISDGKGGTVTVTVNITVNPVVPGNNPPTGTGDTKTTEQDKPVNGNVTGTDPDGDALTFTKGTDPAHGSVVVNPDGTYTYTPAAGYSGNDSFTVIISDGKGGTTTVTVNITVTPKVNAPVAVDDKVETKANTPVTIEVLVNDKAGTSALDEGSVEIIAQPSHGTVTVKEDGTVVYTPATGYSGEDVFTYRVADANGVFSNVATVSITITSSAVNVPNLFTPNGDGKNDNFEIRGLNQYYDNELIIVNRWGNEVYRQKGYQNTWKGEGLNEGTYYYLLRIKRNANAEWEVFKGYVTLIRTFKK
ncbi:Ig-like domain-containing protein [Chitinophaga sp. S165]|uniref:Ig-like domain-containing protein n=1 Tax=Chitinophaga sp. S165 TaxID=2135462 RepID=UPI000D719C8E|nr:Ig-like domain-containing protein [Chitinophaga sp. S165]PWV56983.1 gliding motility-associated-like protein [Chitinophaga sp. S165]